MKKELSFYEEMKVLDQRIKADIKIKNRLWVWLTILLWGCAFFFLLTLLIH
jgi:hypothetical protein